MTFILREFCFVKDQLKHSKKETQRYLLITFYVRKGDIAVTQADSTPVPMEFILQ